jgi:parvulin-like peptidyl-prolyl isomerase
VVQIKLKAIKALAARLAKREALATLVAEASEDEATKVPGGDLGIFSAARVPPEFVAQLEKLRVAAKSTGAVSDAARLSHRATHRRETAASANV